MPPRVSRGSLQSAKPPKAKSSGRNPKKSQKRALDAFSIASHSNPERIRRKHRLGESDVFTHRKRARDDEDEEEDEEDVQLEKKRSKRRRDEDEDFDEGSDSEGNTWTMGHVDEDDDSDIDSDEAFGESDEEKFEGWTFRGSSTNHKNGKAKKRREVIDMDNEDEDIDLDEEESSGGEDDEEDDLGDDAIDLATALDQYEESEEDKKQRKARKSRKGASAFDDSDEEPSEVGDLAVDGASEFSSEDDDDDDEADRRAQLKDLISTLADENEQTFNGPRRPEIHESAAPSEFGVSRKVDLASFKSKLADPEKKKSLKLLQDDESSNRNTISRKLDAPLPKRQQDKLDRAAASGKANETLERWVDTVKQNRRAEHLSFPLNQPDAGSRMGESRLLPTTTTTPTNDLESTIQSILQQSGLSNGKDDEAQIQKWEELQTKKLPLEEVATRRAQLRMERELLFREEVRAKRIKKIKSKSYRRVHRKERERLMERERDALKADGVDVSEDEREYNDRRRAEERMGAKHRESKWARSVKATGQGAWNEDARSGVTEMARRNEELRRRMEGKEVRGEDEDASDFSDEEDDEDLDSDEDANKVLHRQLGQPQENPFSTKQSNLASMAFMQKAEAARKARNDEDIERIRKELASEESDSEEDINATSRGRRKFGPGTDAAATAVKASQNEFEERSNSDDEAGDKDITPVVGKQSTNGASSAGADVGSHNPYLVKAKKEKKPAKQPDLVGQAQDTIAAIQEPPKPKTKSSKKAQSTSLQSLDHGLAGNPLLSAPDEDGFQTVTYDNDDEDAEDIDEESINLDAVLRNQQLTAAAFAGDNVEKEFEDEKKAAVAEENERIEKNVLPGWGSWTGDGLTKNEKRRKGEVTYQKKEGIAPHKRKDAKLSRVIINEKRIKANTKYLSSQLPFPFETKEQYERSLRLPKGPEWTTKRTFQDATKPRVLVKQGIIRPMHKPLS